MVFIIMMVVLIIIILLLILLLLAVLLLVVVVVVVVIVVFVVVVVVVMLVVVMVVIILAKIETNLTNSIVVFISPCRQILVLVTLRSVPSKFLKIVIAPSCCHLTIKLRSEIR